MSYKIGDLVVLKSGGPVMTVQCVVSETMFGCCWFVPGEQRMLNAWFPATTLKTTSHPDPNWEHDGELDRFN
ncbi:MAG: DUF2158 domain-containing protein [Pseudomonadota bacterium]